MTPITDIYRFLAAGLRDDPLLCLAQAVAWLDPFSLIVDEDDDGSLTDAMQILRESFPEIYAQAVQLLHHGASYDDLDREICAAISQRGIPLDSLEGMGFGVPLPAYGVNLHDLDFYTHHPQVVPIVRLFGIDPEEEYPIDVPEYIYITGQRLAESLREQTGEQYQQVGWLLGWLFSCTGNSSVDYDFEMMCEFEPLSWETDDLEFALAIIREADEIMTKVQAGLNIILSNLSVQSALIEPIRRSYHAVEKGKGAILDFRLEWPPLSQYQSSLDGTPHSLSVPSEA